MSEVGFREAYIILQSGVGFFFRLGSVLLTEGRILIPVMRSGSNFSDCGESTNGYLFTLWMSRKFCCC